MSQIDFAPMEQQINRITQDVQQSSQKDMSSPSNLLHLQYQTMQMEMEYGAMSGIIGDIKSIAMNIVQKM